MGESPYPASFGLRHPIPLEIDYYTTSEDISEPNIISSLSIQSQSDQSDQAYRPLSSILALTPYASPALQQLERGDRTTREATKIMAATAGMPDLDIGMHLGAGDFNPMGFGSDVMLDPRMGLRLFGIKGEKDHIESSGQFVLTPRMFDTTGGHGRSRNPLDCVEDLPFGDESTDAAGLIHPDMGRTSPCTVAKAPSPAAQSYSPSLASPPESIASPLPASRMPASTSCEAKRKRSATQTGPSSAMLTRSTTKAASPSSASTATKAHTKRGAAETTTTTTSSSKKCGVAKEAREEARRNRCLERNRIAASKCREKKKTWMQDLETTKAELESQHASLQREYNGLLEEATQTKASLMNHAGCNDPNIDLWIETEAVRFVRRANRMHQEAMSNNTRHSSIASPASLQSQQGSIAYSTSGGSDDTQLSSPGLEGDSITCNYMPGPIYPDDE